MKFCTFLLLIISLYSHHTNGLKFVNPVVYDVQERFGLSWVQLKEKCDSKGANLFSAVSDSRDQYDLISSGVKRSILDAARKSSDKVTEEKWNQLVDTKCLVNPDLIRTSQQAIDRIVLCLDNNGGLNEQGKDKAKQELLGRFCSIIRTWAKFEYDNYNRT